MGQVQGKLLVNTVAQPFVNLPRRNVKRLVEGFHLIAENFQITLHELKEIFRISIQECYNCSDEKFMEMTMNLYNLFSNDGKMLVDAFELLSTFFITSDMKLKEKITLIIDLYDFDKKRNFNIHEITLSMRISASGMCRIANFEKPSLKTLDFLASLVFSDSMDQNQPYSVDISKTISLKEFVDSLLSLQEVRIWLDQINDLDEDDIPAVKVWTDISKAGQNNFFDEEKGCSTKATDRSNISIVNDNHHYANSSVPPISIELDWVYGRNKSAFSNCNALFISENEIVYPAGTVIVKLTINDSSKGGSCQKFYMRHHEYVSCIAISSERSENNDIIVASSEQCTENILPNIHVWSSKSLVTMTTIKGFHRNGIQSLDFSPSGDLLLTVGMDTQQSIVIYRWREKKITFTATTTSNPIARCQFLGTDLAFAACGDSFVYLWESEDDASPYERSRCLFGKSFKVQTMTCLVSIAGRMITGSRDGNIYVWDRRSCVRKLETKSSKAAISTMNASPSNHLCAGTSDGNILIYDVDFELQKRYNIHSFTDRSYRINSLYWKGESILVGTVSSELIEISSSDGKLLRTIVTRGSSNTGAHALSVHPSLNNLVTTVDNDGILQCTDVRSKQEINSKKLGYAVTFVTYNHDGEKIVVGLDGTQAGGFLVVNSVNLSALHKRRPCNEVLLLCKHSTGGNIAVFGSLNTHIYIYETETYSLLSRATGHTSPVVNIDLGYSQDGTNVVSIRSESSSNELIFWSLKGKKLNPNSQNDVLFISCTCCSSWKFQRCCSDNNILTTHTEVCTKSNKGNVLAIATMHGSIQIYNYPPDQNSMYIKIVGQGGSINNIIFSRDDTFLFSMGKSDNSLFQWKFNVKDKNNDKEERIKYDNAKEKDKSRDDHLLSIKPQNHQVDKKLGANGIRNTHIRVEHKKRAMHSWERSIIIPSCYCPSSNVKVAPPPFELEWVFGYNGLQRNNIFYAKEGTCIVYPIGKNLVLFGIHKHEQLIYQEARDVITSVAIHPNRNVCAIGQGKGSNEIMCIDFLLMQTLQTLEGQPKTSICIMKFNPRGNLLVTIADNAFHTLTIYDWEVQTCSISSFQTTSLFTRDIAVTLDGTIFQVGDGLIRLWSVLDQGSISYEDIRPGKVDKVSDFFNHHSVILTPISSELTLSSIRRYNPTTVSFQIIKIQSSVQKMESCCKFVLKKSRLSSMLVNRIHRY